MPFIFRIASTTDNGSATITINIVNENTWSPVTSPTNTPVTESIPFIITGTSDDNIAAQMREINRVIDDVRYYLLQGTALHQVWWEWSMENETAPTPLTRLVYAMDVSFDNREWFECNGGYAPVVRGVLTLVVNGWWQIRDFLLTDDGSWNPIDTLDAPIGGDAPGLLKRFRAGGEPTAGEALAQLWMAFRTARRHGTLANFVFPWECEDGSGLALDCADAMRAGGSPSDLANNCVECDFTVTAAFTGRVFIEIDDVTANFSDQYGQFLVLARFGTDAATSCTVQVNYESETEIFTTGSVLTVATGAAAWRVYDTGLVITIPPGNPRTDIVSLSLTHYGFHIYASREAGTSLYMDALILMPLDEYFIWHDPGDPGTATSIYMFVAPDDSTGTAQYSTAGAELFNIKPMTVEGPGIPYPNPRIYFVGVDGNGENVLTQNMNWRYTLVPRYKNLHGAG